MDRRLRRWMIGGFIVALLARLFAPGTDSAYDWVTWIAFLLFAAALLGPGVYWLVSRRG